jgi:Zn-dependent M28 family amino/carboxypeptidase
MPGVSYTGKFKELGEDELTISHNLKKHVQFLAGSLGERNMAHTESLEKAAAYFEKNFRNFSGKVSSQIYDLKAEAWFSSSRQKDYKPRNIEVEFLGQVYSNEIIVVGAHYDSVIGSPGANDNATGAAGLLEIGGILSKKKMKRTVRLVAFVNEEPPYFKTENMGSYVYAQRSWERREKILGMISLETLGYYSDKKGSQKYPFPLGLFKPDKGNFVAFVSNIHSKPLLNKIVTRFRDRAEFPSDGVVAPQIITGIDWSDQWSFWKFNYPAPMVTDTGPFRYPFYHSLKDTSDKVHYDRLARVVLGISKVIEDLANEPKESNL